MDEVETKVSMIVFDTYFKSIKPTDLKEETIYWVIIYLMLIMKVSLWSLTMEILKLLEL